MALIVEAASGRQRSVGFAHDQTFARKASIAPALFYDDARSATKWTERAALA
jgi:hypothetical protein